MTPDEERRLIERFEIYYDLGMRADDTLWDDQEELRTAWAGMVGQEITEKQFDHMRKYAREESPLAGENYEITPVTGGRWRIERDGKPTREVETRPVRQVRKFFGGGERVVFRDLRTGRVLFWGDYI